MERFLNASHIFNACICNSEYARKACKVNVPLQVFAICLFLGIQSTTFVSNINNY